MAKLVITEDMEQQMIQSVFTEVFHPAAEKVLIVKDFLDKNFTKQVNNDITPNGMPTTNPAFGMMSNNQVVKLMNAEEMLLYLEDQFSTMISNKNDRRSFLKQVLRDWWDDKITPVGILSVNTL